MDNEVNDIEYMPNGERVDGPVCFKLHFDQAPTMKILVLCDRCGKPNEFEWEFNSKNVLVITKYSQCDYDLCNRKQYKEYKEDGLFDCIDSQVS